MDFYSEVGCILRIKAECEACKMKLHDVLRAVAGIYSVEIDSEQGLAKISGEMDPNILLAATAKNGEHGALVWMKMGSPAPRLVRGGYHHHHHHHGGGGIRHGYQSYGPAVDYSYRAGPGLPVNPHQNYVYPPQRAMLDTSPYNYNNSGYGGYNAGPSYNRQYNTYLGGY